MKLSTYHRNGDPVLNRQQQSMAETRHASIDDALARIQAVLGGLNQIANDIDKLSQCDHINITRLDYLTYVDILNDATADLLAKHWTRLIDMGAPINTPVQLPEIGDKNV